MANFVGQPSPINRFLGLCDQDDPTNLPSGLAWICRNMQFTLTSARTRDGINKTIQGVNKSPISGLIGLVYQPETETEDFYQRPLLFDMRGTPQAEYNVGSGIAKEITNSTVELPENSHMIATQAYNKAWMAFSDLLKPTGYMAVYNIKTDTIDPFGMKPFGWTWQAKTPVVLNETATPTVSGGNGHVYQCIQAGTTGTDEPTWPTTEGGTVNDGTVVWKEYTPVLANRLPSPPQPTLTLTAGGTIPANSDVWVCLTYSNAQGETTASLPAMVTTSVGNQSLNVTTPGLLAFSQWIQDLDSQYVPQKLSIYLAVVAHGASQPAGTAYKKALDFTLTAQTQYVIPVSAPPTGNQLGSGSGTINGTQVNQSNSSLIPDHTIYNATQWEIASVSPHQLRTTGAATSSPGLLDYVYFTNFGFNIPSGVVILGISIDINFVSQSATSATLANVRLCKAGAGIGTAKSPNQGFTSASQDLVQGSNSDLWGATLTAADINDATFGFGVQVNISNVRVFLNSASMTVYYAEPNSGSVNSARITPGQLPQPTEGPAISRVAGAGSFPIHRDVYVCVTYTNAAGETTPGPPSAFYDTQTNDAISIETPSPGNFQFTGINVYEADVPRGQGQPPFSQFALVGSYGANQTVQINATAAGSPPPTTNTTGPGGQIAADSPTGGVNDTQGYRYAAVMWINRNGSVSGFTKNSVVKYAVDQDGWQLGMFNIPPGPAYVAGRQIGFTAANGTAAGPFEVIGGFIPGDPTDSIVYPNTVSRDGIDMTATAIGDNTTTSATFNFTDSYLNAGIFTSVTDRLRVMWPLPAVDVYFSESTNRLFMTGAPGWNGHWVSNAGDPESIYSDTGFISTNNSNGERALCVREYRGSLFSFRERSAYVITPGSGDPSTWDIPVRRWSKVGPCGPRAVDVCDDFIIFAHRSGVYRYVDTETDLMTKEVPKLWKTINWEYGHLICVKIDRETHTVRILAPTGDSTVPNQEFVISYIEGWQNPIHFSPYAQREVSMDAARRWSTNDVAAFVCDRIERTIPDMPPFMDGMDGLDRLASDFYTSQVVYGSSAPDGTVQAITPGIFSDNGQGIDWEYETVAPQGTLAVCMIEGFSLNAKGNGTLNASLVGGRAMTTGWNPEGSKQKTKIVKARTIDLTPDLEEGISRTVPNFESERWRLNLRGDKQPGSWAEFKWAAIYTIPVAGARSDYEGV